MIFDELNHLADYKGIHRNSDAAIDYLLNHDMSLLDLGRYEIDGERAFFFVQENTLHREPSDSFEFHKRYLDLHFLLRGREKIVYGCGEKDIRKAYDAEADIGFAVCKSAVPFILDESCFAAFLPEESHRPNGFAGRGENVRKCVVKVQLD
ncbi:YhcH/YjgK/YiaL family protein [Streptococcus panodentis]|uniref:Beta-galactosidase n=1 Tax=Streptococcus panodentis TaxID=1581472 RepID=A0ABS5AWQ1_9STRE|nr:YhcH/YjgK/YiaL family protein [Streptococcus panodentis]MBP2621008.1 beta-galactosidase [Streptococcus panodentis]